MYRGVLKGVLDTPSLLWGRAWVILARVRAFFASAPMAGANPKPQQWFRGGLVFEAHRLLYHSAL